MCRAETPRSAAARNQSMCWSIFGAPSCPSRSRHGPESVAAALPDHWRHWQLKLAGTRCSGRAPPFLQQPSQSGRAASILLAIWPALDAPAGPASPGRSHLGSHLGSRLDPCRPHTHAHMPSACGSGLGAQRGWTSTIGSSKLPAAARRFRRHRHSIKNPGSPQSRGMRAMRVVLANN